MQTVHTASEIVSARIVMRAIGTPDLRHAARALARIARPEWTMPPSQMKREQIAEIVEHARRVAVMELPPQGQPCSSPDRRHRAAQRESYRIASATKDRIRDRAIGGGA